MDVIQAIESALGEACSYVIVKRITSRENCTTSPAECLGEFLERIPHVSIF